MNLEMMKEQLEALKDEKKFVDDYQSMYPGAPDEETQVEIENGLNAFISHLIEGLVEFPEPIKILEEFRMYLNGKENIDTEERERICYYLEKIMDIYGIECSGGILNDFMYGF